MEKIRQDVVQKAAPADCKTIDSPVGPLTIFANDSALISLMWGKNPTGAERRESNHHPILVNTERQLQEYFNGSRFVFDLPLAPEGTAFQKRVWQELLKIPFGHHITYGDQARRLGQPKAARAVGAANGKNPIGIIIPCHRVLGASGALTGFAGGLEIKRKLLALESIDL